MSGGAFSLIAKGTWDKTKAYLNRLAKEDWQLVLESAGERGVEALREATPKRTGLTSESWSYRIEQSAGIVKIIWENSNKTYQGDYIALLIQYGHGTGRGTYVRGRDYINPAVQKVFDGLANDVWKVVSGE